MTSPNQHSHEETRALLARELERVKRADPFKILGLPPSATAENVRAAFLVAVKRFHPSRFARYPKDVGALATEVFLKILEAQEQATAAASKRTRRAHGTDAPPVRGTPMPTRSPRAQAKPMSRAAKPRAVGSSSHPVAPRSERQPAFGVGTGVAERKREEAFARAKSMLGSGRFGDAKEAFRQIALTAPQEKKYRAYMHLAWGREYAAAGDVDKARDELNRALVLDPSLDPAKDAMEKLPKKKGGLFKRLFK